MIQKCKRSRDTRQLIINISLGGCILLPHTSSLPCPSPFHPAGNTSHSHYVRHRTLALPCSIIRKNFSFFCPKLSKIIQKLFSFFSSSTNHRSFEQSEIRIINNCQQFSLILGNFRPIDQAPCVVVT